MTSRLRCTNGAVGGLDLPAAAAAAAPFDEVMLRTTIYSVLQTLRGMTAHRPLIA